MKKLTILIMAALLCLIVSKSFTTFAEQAETRDPQLESMLTGQLYGIGSVSKVFTAAAVMKLVDGGRLDLDEPIVTYIPEFAMEDPRYVDITPRMLLNHSSGLMGLTDNNAWLLGDNDTFNHDHFLDYLKEQRLRHDPGELSVYSNDSFTLAEILVEYVSGQSFTGFIESNFLEPMGIEDIKSPQSNFDRGRLAPNYLGDNELLPENLGVIGSGGLYSSMEDLCRYAAIFMKDADGSVLSRESVDEMATNQHKKTVVDSHSDTTFLYGLGWDSVNTYPFNQYGIQALSKGGGTMLYHTNLTVLPEYNLAAAVSSSGQDKLEQLIAQEIILEVLKEEGLIGDISLILPEYDTQPVKIPEHMKAYAGLYDTGKMGCLLEVAFSDSMMTLTPIGTRNERPQEYIYNQNGEFVSTKGDYIAMGMLSARGGTRGISVLGFTGDGFITMQSYENVSGLSQNAYAMPFAQKISPNQISKQLVQIWNDRINKDYLLINEKYSSSQYISAGIARLGMDDRVPGYVYMGTYKGKGALIGSAVIIDETRALGYQNTPTMTGREINDLAFSKQNGVDILSVNNYRYIDADSIASTSDVVDTVHILSEAVWYNVDAASSGQKWHITMPEHSSWFLYDDKMNCIATSLEKERRPVVTLPENGRIVFAGEVGSNIQITKE